MSGKLPLQVTVQDASDRWEMWLIDYPLDIVFALNQIASTPLEGLDGIMDADRAGITGYSFDGYNSLADEINPYDLEAVYIFEHLGTPERAMISFVGWGHMMIFSSDPVARMKHFATAFFGYHLQGREDYAEYFSEDFVRQFDNLAWGVYTNGNCSG